MQHFVIAVLFAVCVQCHAQTFTVEHISDDVYARIVGLSLPATARIDTADLRYLRMSHYHIDGSTAVGEMIVHKDLAEEVIDIFRELYSLHYPIESMRLIDDFGADDERSMEANNSSSFCYRTTPGSTVLSHHSRGRAIDINPLYNPYIKGAKVLPVNARPYIDRSRPFIYKIDTSDPAYKAFTRRGWRWGGHFRSLKDYQHFEK